MNDNPLAPALKAARQAWIEVAAYYERRDTPLEESWAVHRAFLAVEAAHAHLALLRHKRGVQDEGVDLTNLVAFDMTRTVSSTKGKKRRSRKAQIEALMQ